MTQDRPRERTRVMIVEDSAVVRHLLTSIISRDARLTVAVAVSTAEEALSEIERIKPDVISMDIRLPGMDGLEATRRIMTEMPTPIVVIAGGSYSEDGSLALSMSALKAGALTVVEKPVGVASADYESIAKEICTQLYIMSQVSVIRRRGFGTRTTRQFVKPDMAQALPGKPSVVAIAASTGGPPALARVIGSLPKDFAVPILVVQHMGASFMEGFAQWLDGLVDLPVGIAQDGETALAGHVYVAPGDRHLELGSGNRLQVTSSAPVGGQRPAATVMFRSLARSVGPRGLGVVLTGMGEDGASGLLDLRQAGGYVIAEHETTCVVYGMPGAAVRAGAVNVAMPLDAIALKLTQIVGAERG